MFSTVKKKCECCILREKISFSFRAFLPFLQAILFCDFLILLLILNTETSVLQKLKMLHLPIGTVLQEKKSREFFHNSQGKSPSEVQLQSVINYPNQIKSDLHLYHKRKDKQVHRNDDNSPYNSSPPTWERDHSNGNESLYFYNFVILL